MSSKVRSPWVGGSGLLADRPRRARQLPPHEEDRLSRAAGRVRSSRSPPTSPRLNSTPALWRKRRSAGTRGCRVNVGRPSRRKRSCRERWSSRRPPALRCDERHECRVWHLDGQRPAPMPPTRCSEMRTKRGSRGQTGDSRPPDSRCGALPNRHARPLGGGVHASVACDRACAIPGCAQRRCTPPGVRRNSRPWPRPQRWTHEGRGRLSCLSRGLKRRRDSPHLFLPEC